MNLIPLLYSTTLGIHFVYNNVFCLKLILVLIHLKYIPTLLLIKMIEYN